MGLYKAAEMDKKANLRPLHCRSEQYLAEIFIAARHLADGSGSSLIGMDDLWSSLRQHGCLGGKNCDATNLNKNGGTKDESIGLNIVHLKFDDQAKRVIAYACEHAEKNGRSLFQVHDLIEGMIKEEKLSQRPCIPEWLSNFLYGA